MNIPLTPEAILSLLPSGEGYNAEFKIRVPSKLKDLSEEICAFANAAGGVLLLGGGLTSAISLAEFGSKSHSWNPLIFGLFVRIHMVEQVGSGIGRIRNQMKVAKLPAPLFKTEGMFTVVLHRTVEETVEETVAIILNAMKHNPRITAKELQKTTGLTRRGVEYHIDKLKKGKRIKRMGSTKAGYWELITHHSSLITHHSSLKTHHS